MTLPIPPATLQVSIPTDQEHVVDYYAPIDLRIRILNDSPDVVIVERVAVRFNADYEIGSATVIQACNTRLEPGGIAEAVVTVTPLAHYVPYTNVFGVRVSFRQEAERSGRLREENHQPPGAYIVIDTPRPTLGRIFISFKEPEDLRLMARVKALAERAGFAPWTARGDVGAGRPVWPEIEQAIRESVAVIHIWTENTGWTDGVAKEVRICRDSRVREIPLIEQRLALPAPYHDSDVHYERFELETPTTAFADIVHKLRSELLTGH